MTTPSPYDDPKNIPSNTDLGRVIVGRMVQLHGLAQGYTVQQMEHKNSIVHKNTTLEGLDFAIEQETLAGGVSGPILIFSIWRRCNQYLRVRVNPTTLEMVSLEGIQPELCWLEALPILERALILDDLASA